MIYPVIRLLAALLLMTVGGSAMYATIVALVPLAAEFGTSRGVASMPYMLFMLGFGLGGVVMGRVADRIGVMLPAFAAAIALPAGLIGAGYAANIWQLCATIGLVAGFFGAAPTFGPLVADISHWFDRRRGLAVAIVISGTYVAGTVWPPVVQYFIDAYGWRQTFVGLGVFAFAVMLPLAALFYVKTPNGGHPSASDRKPEHGRPLGLEPATLQGLICLAGIGCCVAMAMPQVHIVAYATDLGYAAARAAEMLSLMLGCGIVSRLASGWISDRIGGVRTLLLGSFLQALVLVAFLFWDSLSALYLLSIAFGLSQGGIVPSYAILIRTFFPPGDAGWRIGLSLLFTMVGMAMGGWMAGAIYDLTGSYTWAFVNAIGFNVLNLALAGSFLLRARRSAGNVRLARPA